MTKDPETRTTQSGIVQCSFTVAVRRKYKNQSGEYDTDFLPVVAWRQTAELCSKYLAKGRKVSVEGTIQTRSYEAQDGSKRYVTEIIADSVEFLTPRGESGQSGAQTAQEPPAGYGQGFTELPDDDQLPF